MWTKVRNYVAKRVYVWYNNLNNQMLAAYAPRKE